MSLMEGWGSYTFREFHCHREGGLGSEHSHLLSTCGGLEESKLGHSDNSCQPFW